MIKNTLTALLFAAVLYAPQAAATNPPPFQTSVVTAGQEFPANTTWYTLQIGSSGLFLSDNGTEKFIALGRGVSQTQDIDLWCFVGNDTDGYRIYNKAAGTSKVLAASTANAANTGGDAYVILKEANKLEGYIDRWVFSKSDKLTGKTAYFINLKGHDSWKINDRGGKLAFWTGGADHGSSVQIAPLGGEVVVAANTGTFTKSNPAKTYHAQWTSSGVLPLTLDSNGNNMNASGNILQLHSGGNKRASYTFTAPVGFVLKSVEMDFELGQAGKNISVEVDGKSTKATTTAQHLSLKGDGKSNVVAFQVVGDNNPLKITNVKVQVERVKITLEPQKNLFVYTNGTPVTYRIPAIAVTGKSGTIVAVSDSRHTGTGDVGAGRVDLFATRSHDNGATWDTPAVFSDANGKPVAEGTGKKVDNDVNKSRNAGYGDAAVVADRESDDVLVMSVSGFTNFFSARRNTPNAVARWYSHDGGKTFTPWEDITEDIYKQFDGTTPRGKIESMFFGSGRIVQSHRTKVGSHYRLYAVMSGLNVSPNNVANWVMYSDDFGKNWKILGDPMTPAIPHSADEPKCEELPDGSIVVSSRRNQGRWFNIFRFTDTAKGEGYWDTMAHSTLVKSMDAACNGELMILPVVKNATKEKMYLALQSIPFGPNGRRNVGINYKELAGYNDFGSSANFAKEWDGAHQSSYVGSAYSVMAWQKNDRLAFMYEEETFRSSASGGYTQVYKNYSIEQITDSAYSYAPDADFKVADAQRTEVLKARLEALKKQQGTKLGNLTAEGWKAVEKAANDYLAAPSAAAYEAFNLAEQKAERVALTDKMNYALHNVAYKGEFYLKFNGEKVNGVGNYDAATKNFHVIFYNVKGHPGQVYLYNEASQKYLEPLKATYGVINTTSDQSQAGIYQVEILPNGNAVLKGVNGAGAGQYLHLDGQHNFVAWQPSEPSQWEILPTGVVTSVQELPTAADEVTPAAVNAFDLSGRKVGKEHKGVTILANGKKVVR